MHRPSGKINSPKVGYEILHKRALVASSSAFRYDVDQQGRYQIWDLESLCRKVGAENLT